MSDKEGTVDQKVQDILKNVPAKWKKINSELDKRIIGQDRLINDLLVAIFARGHCLLIGVPGLAKTLLIQTLGQIADLDFSRIQFTPDMMPSDITGSEILEVEQSTGRREYKFIRGPVFSQLILADEINRTPPKTQAALLEAMQEHKVTVAGKNYVLKEPFFVLATQNPIEQEGTYPLPEAQLDRFMFSLNVSYPEYEDEIGILLTTTRDDLLPLEKVISAAEIVEIQAAVRQVHVSRSVAEYTVRLVRATRPEDLEEVPAESAAGEREGGGNWRAQIREYHLSKEFKAYVKKYIRWGAGPRACQYLALAGKVYAVLDGRLNVSIEDIQQAANPVLRHRLILNYHAEADRVQPEDLIARLIKAVK